MTENQEIFDLVEELETMLEDINGAVDAGDIVEDMDHLKTELTKVRDLMPIACCLS